MSETITRDENGKRWDSYTFDDWLKLNRHEAKTTDDDETLCAGGMCEQDPDGLYRYMKKGEKCVWQKVSYEYDEWEAECAHCYKERWLTVMTTDWEEIADVACLRKNAR